MEDAVEQVQKDLVEARRTAADAQDGCATACARADVASKNALRAETLAVAACQDAANAETMAASVLASVEELKRARETSCDGKSESCPA